MSRKSFVVFVSFVIFAPEREAVARYGSRYDVPP